MYFPSRLRSTHKPKEPEPACPASYSRNFSDLSPNRSHTLTRPSYVVEARYWPSSLRARAHTSPAALPGPLVRSNSPNGCQPPDSASFHIFTSPPKPADAATLPLFETARWWQPSLCEPSRDWASGIPGSEVACICIVEEPLAEIKDVGVDARENMSVMCARIGTLDLSLGTGLRVWSAGPSCIESASRPWSRKEFYAYHCQWYALWDIVSTRNEWTYELVVPSLCSSQFIFYLPWLLPIHVDFWWLLLFELKRSWSWWGWCDVQYSVPRNSGSQAAGDSQLAHSFGCYGGVNNKTENNLKR